MTERDRVTVRVGVMAGDPLRSVGLLAILNEVSGWEAVSLTAERLGEAERMDVLLLDSTMSEHPLQLIARLRRDEANCRTILMSHPLSLDEVQEVIAAGAKGYLPDTARESEIRMALEVVLDGSVWAPRKVLARLIEAGGVHPLPRRAADSLFGRMTTKEREVMELLMLGRTNRDIAGVMGIEEVTVKAHLGRMLRKGGVKNRVELTLKALAERKEDEQFPET